MSIAVSVVLKPSRLLFMLVSGICLGAALVGLLIGVGAVGEWSPWLRVPCAGLCVALALAGWVGMLQRQTIHHLDISGIGQIRLHAVVADRGRAMLPEESAADGLLVKLLADSTLWPRFLLLRLQTEDGHIHNVPILHDCLPEASFRRVAVACRWIAAHNPGQQNGI